LDELAEQIIQRTSDQIQQDKNHLKQNAVDLQAGTIAFLKAHHQMVNRNLDFIKKQPQKILTLIFQNTKENKINLVKAIRTQMASLKNRLQGYEKMVAIADPAGTLKRGFSIARNAQGKVIKEISQVTVGENVETELSDGYMASHVRGLVQSKKRRGDR
jgi:exodeoxyribonuclease VII large subunit